MSVTQTSTPASRRRRTSSSRFSSLLAITRSGASAAMALVSGFLVPRMRVTSRSAGCVHQSVTPTSAPRSTLATASVRDGTRLTTRRTAAGRSARRAPGRRAHTLRRYCPPTSKNASVTCCSEHTRAASIRTAKTLSPLTAASLSRAMRLGGLGGVGGLEGPHAGELRLLLGLGGASQLDLRRE